jgi:hypothetical protein
MCLGMSGTYMRPWQREGWLELSSGSSKSWQCIAISLARSLRLPRRTIAVNTLANVLSHQKTPKRTYLEADTYSDENLADDKSIDILGNSTNDAANESNATTNDEEPYRRLSVEYVR